MSWAEHSVEIEAPIETCFDAIVDYESFPGWQNAVDSVRVRDRHQDGLGRDVQLFVDAKVRKIDYVLRYSYDRPTRIEWDFVEGNGMREVDGVYTFEPLGPGRTRATYKLGADPEIPVPGLVLRRTHKQLVKRSVEDLKREAERRAAGGGTVGVRADEPGEDESAAPSQPDSGNGSTGSNTGEWEPKAARESPPASARPERPAGARGGIGSIAELPVELAGKAAGAASGAVRTARGIAGGVVRAGLEKGADVADRIDRRLSGRDD